MNNEFIHALRNSIFSVSFCEINKYYRISQRKRSSAERPGIAPELWLTNGRFTPNETNPKLRASGRK